VGRFVRNPTYGIPKCSLTRNRNTKLELDALIADIINKTHNKKKSKSNKIQPYIATSLRIIRKARAKGKIIANINIITTLAQNISKKTTSVRT
jgi:hypothetical protein